MRHRIDLSMDADAPAKRVLLLHGWSPGPRLPRSLRHPGFIVDEIPTSGICDILTSPCGLAFFALPVIAIAAVVAAWGVAHAQLGGALGAAVGAPILGLVTVAVGLTMWSLKRRAVGFVVRAGVKQIKAKIQANGGAPYDIIAAYSWGGASAVLASAMGGVHSGSLLLFAPASEMLLGHAGLAR